MNEVYYLFTDYYTTRNREQKYLSNAAAAGADERDGVVRGLCNRNGSSYDVIVRPRDRGIGRDGVAASDWMINSMLAAVVVADF